MNAALDFAAAIDPRWILIALLGVLDLWASTLVVFSTAPRREKWLWVAVILACPIVGCVFWFVFGPKWRPNSAGDDSGLGAPANAPGSADR